MRTLGWVIGIGLALALAACGEVGGGGQCGGVESSGICVSVNSISLKDGASGEETANVDAFQNPDCDSTTAGAQLEPITDHSATVKLSVFSLPNVPLNALAPSVTANSARVEFALAPGASGPAIDPIEQSLTLQIAVSPTGPTEGSADIRFVPFEAKTQYVSRRGVDTTPVPYIGTVTISGVDLFTRSFTVQGASTFSIGGFDNCPGGKK